MGEEEKEPQSVGAPHGNKNAEKWTLEEAQELFEKAVTLSEKVMEEKRFNKDGEPLDSLYYYKFDFIGEVARELQTYHDIFLYLANKFTQLKEYHTILLRNLEANCFSNSKKGVIREATAIVNLKSNYKWRDRVEQTGTQTVVNTVPLTVEEIQKAKESLEGEI